MSHHGIKWYLNVCIKMVRQVTNTEEESCTPHFRSKCATSLTGETPDVQEAMDKVSYTRFIQIVFVLQFIYLFKLFLFVYML